MRRLVSHPSPLGRWFRRPLPLLAVLAASLAAPGQACAEQGDLAIELNKLETQAAGCRAYIVVTNKRPTLYQSLKLDLIVFQPDGVIGRRFAFELGPLKPNKRTVKLFEIKDTACDQVGSLLINDVLACEVDQTPQPDCLTDIAPTSLTKVQLTK